MKRDNEQVINGKTKLFSSAYRPGLTYDHNSKKAYGSTTRKLKLNTNFKGTKNGEVTPVAIKEEFCPNEVIIGSEKKL